MREALFDIPFHYSSRRLKDGERSRMNLSNLCRTALGDNHSLDIRNNNTIPTLWATHNADSNVEERNRPIEQANQENSCIDWGCFRG